MALPQTLQRILRGHSDAHELLPQLSMHVSFMHGRLLIHVKGMSIELEHPSKTLQSPTAAVRRAHRLLQAVPEGLQRLLVSGQIEACQGAGRPDLLCIHVLACTSRIGLSKKLLILSLKGKTILRKELHSD